MRVELSQRADSDPPLPTRNRAHQPLPFVQTSAKAQFAGCVETQSSIDLATLSPFCVVRVPIMAARNKDVRRERVVFGFHHGEFRLNVTYRRSQPFQCALKACDSHNVQPNIIFTKRQTVTPASSPGEFPKQRSREGRFSGLIFDL
jgi:hypothetical protein